MNDLIVALFDMTRTKSILMTRKSSCVTARGVPPMGYPSYLWHALSYRWGKGTRSGGSTPTLVRAGVPYLRTWLGYSAPSLLRPLAEVGIPMAKLGPPHLAELGYVPGSISTPTPSLGRIGYPQPNWGTPGRIVLTLDANPGRIEVPSSTIGYLSDRIGAPPAELGTQQK